MPKGPCFLDSSSVESLSSHLTPFCVKSVTGVNYDVFVLFDVSVFVPECMCATGVQGPVGVRRGYGGCESLSFCELEIEPDSSA